MADYKKLSESTFNMQAKTYDTDKNGKHARTLYQHVINQLETIKFDNLLDVGWYGGNLNYCKKIISEHFYVWD
ncbi:hypothetical protein LC724_00040 [Blautia sp. RD014234]|nr:hypothetical protein [Blautia parvula]